MLQLTSIAGYPPSKATHKKTQSDTVGPSFKEGGGSLASWLVHLSPDQVVWVPDLPHDIVLCSNFLGKTLYSHSTSLHPGV